MRSRDRIIAAAMELFYRNGYLGTGIEDILAAAHVSRSNFYYHFASKEELGMAVLDQRRDEFHRLVVQTLLNRGMEPRDRLETFLGEMVRAQDGLLNGGCPLGNLAVEMTEHSERFRCYLAGVFGGLTAVVKDLVSEGQAMRQIRVDVDPHELAVLVVQLVQGMQVITKCRKSAEPCGPSVDLLLRLIHPI